MLIPTLNFRVLLLIGWMVFGVECDSLARGQILHASGPLPSFEVATIKPWHRIPNASPLSPDVSPVPKKVMKVSPGSLKGQPMDRIHMILPIEILIAQAYNLPPSSGSRIVGGPNWLRQDIDQYEIQAKIEDSIYIAMQKMVPSQQREQVALMEQSLLADRFKLKAHFETRELPVYTLIVAKGGSKLIPAKDGESNRLSALNNEQGSEMTATAVTLDQFVLSPLLTGQEGGRQIVDKTGLKGAYDFTLKSGSYRPVSSGAEQEGGADAPSLFTALQEQLGLRLVPSKAPVEVIVIDHIEPPSAN
jgi:bla regulator protein BlaR1